MAQETLNGLQDDIEAIDMAVDMSLEDLAAGRYYTQEQAKQRRAQFADSLFYATAV